MVNATAAVEFLPNDAVRLRDQQRDVPSDTVGRILGRFPHPAGPTYAVSFVDEKLSVLEVSPDQIVLVEDFSSLGPQVPVLVIGTPLTVISIGPHDAAAIIDLLQAQGGKPAIAVADKIERATRLYNSAEVDVGSGEDEQMLAALDKLRQGRGQLGRTLTRLENALLAKITATRRAAEPT